MNPAIAAVAVSLHLFSAGIALAQPGTTSSNVDERLRAFLREIRCLVCQNETLAESRADLAIDLREEIRAQMVAGRTDDEIRNFLTDRYGDFVLYRPPLKPSTYVLWFGPFALLGSGLLMLVRAVMLMSPSSRQVRLPSGRELQQVRRLLARERKGPSQ